ncbi:hypothetical protein GCM10025762_07440 [Haloechinothrix salitolerans]
MVSIEVRNAYVDFPIFDAKTRSLKKRVLGKVGGHIGMDSKVPIIEALRDINLSLSEGDRVGLVGHNGAGKSTLLRLLSGIYEPTRGTAKIRGRVAPVFDLGVGMDNETSGYENIIVRGLYLGMTRKQMEKRVDDIADFTELGDYLQMPLRTYSTGMRVRLALGVVTSIDPEILLLDEGIGAVDAAFLKKARSRLVDLVNRSGLLVFASHQDGLLMDLCTSAIWMDGGEMKQQGPLRDVLTEYKGKDPFEKRAARRGVKKGPGGKGKGGPGGRGGRGGGKGPGAGGGPRAGGGKGAGANGATPAGGNSDSPTQPTSDGKPAAADSNPASTGTPSTGGDQ